MEIQRHLANRLKSRLVDGGLSTGPAFAQGPTLTKIDAFTAPESDPNLLDRGKYVFLNGRIVRRLPFDNIATPVEAKRQFVIDSAQQLPYGPADIKEYEKLITNRNYNQFLNKASLDASKRQNQQLQDIGKNTEQSRRYLQSLRDNIKDLKQELKTRQASGTSAPLKLPTISGISSITPTPSLGQERPVQEVSDELFNKTKKFVQTYRINQGENIDELTQAELNYIETKNDFDEGKATQEEVNDAYEKLNSTVNDEFDKILKEEDTLDPIAEAEQVETQQEEGEAGPSKSQIINVKDFESLEDLQEKLKPGDKVRFDHRFGHKGEIIETRGTVSGGLAIKVLDLTNPDKPRERPDIRRVKKI